MTVEIPKQLAVDIAYIVLDRAKEHKKSAEEAIEIANQDLTKQKEIRRKMIKVVKEDENFADKLKAFSEYLLKCVRNNR